MGHIGLHGRDPACHYFPMMALTTVDPTQLTYKALYLSSFTYPFSVY